MKLNIKGIHSIAEWLTLSISILLILGISVFLLRDSRQPESDHLEIKTEVLKDQSKQIGDHFVIPVKVSNLGERTAQFLSVEFKYTDKSGQEQSTDLEVDYLGRHSSRVLYKYIDVSAEGAQIKVTPNYYKFE